MGFINAVYGHALGIDFSVEDNINRGCFCRARVVPYVCSQNALLVKSIFSTFPRRTGINNIQSEYDIVGSASVRPTQKSVVCDSNGQRTAVVSEGEKEMADDAAVVPAEVVTDGGDRKGNEAAERDPRQGQAPVEKPSFAQLMMKVLRESRTDG